MKLSSKVLRIMKQEQISAEELAYMLRHAAITRVRDCNCRYFHWLFLVKDDQLEDMQRIDVVKVGEGDSHMLEEHAGCQGMGCKGCGWVGQISRAVKDGTAIRLEEQEERLMFGRRR